MPKQRACVSISGALYRELRASCAAHGVVLASLVEAVIHRSINEAQGSTGKCAEMLELVRLTGPASTAAAPAAEVSVTFKAWNRMLRMRRSLYPHDSAVKANSRIVNAMLDKAGAP